MWYVSFLSFGLTSHFGSKDELEREQRNHGAMYVSVVAGSDKTTVSVATGHQECHPVYVSAGNLTNTAQ